MIDGDVVDQLHHDHGFTDTSTPEQTNLTAAPIRSQQV
jgi:hypothetical protein